MAQLRFVLVILVLIFSGPQAISASRNFTFVNSCSFTVWPGSLSNAGMDILWQGGTTLAPGATFEFATPPGWAGRFWGRSDCVFDSTGAGVCQSGDCGRGLYCNGAGGIPPATLAEFTLNGYDSQDFYDVSLVDGYNLPLTVVVSGAKNGTCGSPGCVSDLNLNCPSELQVVVSGRVVACKSACEEYNTAMYCCTGTSNTPATCGPTNYSQIFKAACPTAYSYAYDDLSSTFTCGGIPEYTLTFCSGGTRFTRGIAYTQSERQLNSVVMRTDAALSPGAAGPPGGPPTPVVSTIPPPPATTVTPPTGAGPPPAVTVPPPSPLTLVPPPPSTSVPPPPSTLVPPPPLGNSSPPPYPPTSPVTANPPPLAGANPPPAGSVLPPPSPPAVATPPATPPPAVGPPPPYPPTAPATTTPPPPPLTTPVTTTPPPPAAPVPPPPPPLTTTAPPPTTPLLVPPPPLQPAPSSGGISPSSPFLVPPPPSPPSAANLPSLTPRHFSFLFMHAVLTLLWLGAH